MCSRLNPGPIEIALEQEILMPAAPKVKQLTLTEQLRKSLSLALNSLSPSQQYLYPPLSMRQSMDSFFRSFLVIKKSRFPHGGLGVFVKPQCTIPANTCISWYSGILRSPNPTDVDNSYLFQNVADVFLTDPTSLHDSSFPTYLSRLNENIFHSLDAEGVASQDSDLPSVNNCRFSNSLLGHFTLGAVVTSRRIKAGEELTIFLGHDYGPAWSHYYSHLIQHILTSAFKFFSGNITHSWLLTTLQLFAKLIIKSFLTMFAAP
jgi:hypothetical protein